MDTIKIILTNSKFWTSLFLLVQAVLFYLAPSFPETIWAAADLLFGTVITVLLVGEAKTEQKAFKGETLGEKVERKL